MTERKDDRIIFKAMERMNRGDHTGAASMFQRAGNQYRNPKEKDELWRAADRCRRIAASD